MKITVFLERNIAGNLVTSIAVDPVRQITTSEREALLRDFGNVIDRLTRAIFPNPDHNADGKLAELKARIEEEQAKIKAPKNTV